MAKILAENDLIDNLIRDDYLHYLVIGIPSAGMLPGKEYADIIGLEYDQAANNKKQIN